MKLNEKTIEMQSKGGITYLVGVSSEMVDR